MCGSSYPSWRSYSQTEDEDGGYPYSVSNFVGTFVALLVLSLSEREL